VKLLPSSYLSEPRTAPFKTRAYSERGGDHEKNNDDQPLRGSVALVGIHSEAGLDPAMPEKRDDGEDAGD